MPTKLNNRRIYGPANTQPCHKAAYRKKEAMERQAAFSELTIQQKVALLDARLGKDVGAVKQRARLAALLHKQHNKSQPVSEEKFYTTGQEKVRHSIKKSNGD